MGWCQREFKGKPTILREGGGGGGGGSLVQRCTHAALFVRGLLSMSGLGGLEHHLFAVLSLIPFW